ncbi:MAG: site-specific DNA-methyltransferase [Muribaculaceae bacterium]|nr:site-specific DNA-methyltransferase [Muribaculaceae bacterium]
MKATDRLKLIDRIKTLDGLTDEERSSLLGLLRESKTYGLVWEDKPEDVEERLREELPVLIEDKNKALTSGGEDAPNHILIEGDNLESLTSLAYTHAGKIDVIYIDPPYNTGNKDFVYNDSYVDGEDSYRHSKWLSFMSKRLKIAKKLLSERGVIFISIDDNEQANLKILCDEIFGIPNFVSIFLWRKKSTTSNVKGAEVSSLCDYNLCYKKSPISKIKCRIKSKEDRKFPYHDELGWYRTTVIEKKDAGAYQRDSMKYSILGHFPRSGKRWQIGEKKARELEMLGRFIYDGQKILLKVYDFEQEDTTSAQPNLLLEHGTTDNAAKLVNNEILGIPELFSNPKPTELVSHFISLCGDDKSYILDFFAGSGTTLHATMQLNAEDGGKRQCILCTNNENGICENVTYERNKRVIKGYTKPNGEFVEGLKDNNLRYYRTAFVGRERSIKNMRHLVHLATDMLCIKENLYDEKKRFAGMPTYKNIYRYFENDEKRMLIIYDERYIEEIVKMIQSVDCPNKIKVYVFSPSEDPWEATFEPVEEKIELCALPYAIYNAYKRVLPKRRAKLINQPEEETESQIDEDEMGGLFEQKGGEK